MSFPNSFLTMLLGKGELRRSFCLVKRLFASSVFSNPCLTMLEGKGVLRRNLCTVKRLPTSCLFRTFYWRCWREKEFWEGVFVLSNISLWHVLSELYWRCWWEKEYWEIYVLSVLFNVSLQKSRFRSQLWINTSDSTTMRPVTSGQLIHNNEQNII